MGVYYGLFVDVFNGNLLKVVIFLDGILVFGKYYYYEWFLVVYRVRNVFLCSVVVIVVFDGIGDMWDDMMFSWDDFVVVVVWEFIEDNVVIDV